MTPRLLAVPSLDQLASTNKPRLTSLDQPASTNSPRPTSLDQLASTNQPRPTSLDQPASTNQPRPTSLDQPALGSQPEAASLKWPALTCHRVPASLGQCTRASVPLLLAESGDFVDSGTDEFGPNTQSPNRMVPCCHFPTSSCGEASFESAFSFSFGRVGLLRNGEAGQLISQRERMNVILPSFG
eukprot:5312518-Pleurochrysis_carterae.AAC.1